MTFWIIVAMLSIGVGTVLGLTLMRGRVGDAPPAAYDLQVYRDQLREVDRDTTRGVIGGRGCRAGCAPKSRARSSPRMRNCRPAAKAADSRACLGSSPRA